MMPELLLMNAPGYSFGVLGSLVVEKLLERKHHGVAFDVPTKANRKMSERSRDDSEVEIVRGGIRDEAQMASLVHRVDAVLHLAAIIAPFAERNPESSHAVNVGGAESIPRAIGTAENPRLMVSSSSIPVFGPRKQGAPLCAPRDELERTDHPSGHNTHGEQRVQELSSPWAIRRLGG
jgi:nucleoside-diphosphate-sugar epimerase